MVSWKIRRKKPDDPKIVKKTPKDSFPSVIREKTPDQGSAPPIKHKTPDSSSIAEKFKIPPPRLSTSGRNLNEEPFIPSRDGFSQKKKRKEQFASLPPPNIKEETYPDNLSPPPKKSPLRIKEQPHTRSNTPQNVSEDIVKTKSLPSSTGGRIFEKSRINRPLPIRGHHKKPKKNSTRTIPTPIGANKIKPSNSTNSPLSVSNRNKPFLKGTQRSPPRIKKSKKFVNHFPPEKITTKIPRGAKNSKLKTKNPKKVVNRSPPRLIRSKTPTQKDKIKPPPTSKEKIPKTQIKHKIPR